MMKKIIMLLMLTIGLGLQSCADYAIQATSDTPAQIGDDGSILVDPSNPNIVTPSEPTPDPGTVDPVNPNPPVTPTPDTNSPITPTPEPNPPVTPTPNPNPPANEAPLVFYSNDTFFESVENDGSISTMMLANVVGDSYALNPDDFLLENVHFIVEHVPVGLTVQVQMTSSTRVDIRLIGQAEQHEQVDSITDGKITFLSTAFAQGQAPHNGSEQHVFAIDFKDDDSIVMYSTMARQGSLVGGRSGADAWCSQFLPEGVERGQVRALISINADDEIVDMKQNYLIPGDKKIASSTGEVFADNWQALLNGDISGNLEDAQILVHDNGNRVAWWSGSTQSGTLADNCEQFSELSASGVIGDNKEPVNWIHTTYININPIECWRYARLVCVAFNPIF